MALRTVKAAAFTPPSQVFAFEEGVLSGAEYEIAGYFQQTDGTLSPVGLTDYSLKTAAGFTLTFGTAGTFWALVSEYGTPAVSDSVNIITLAQIKEYLNKSDTVDDLFLISTIGIVSDSMEKYCNSIISPRDFTGLIEDGKGRSRLYLSDNRRPIISLATPHIDDVQYKVLPTDASWTTLIDDTDNLLIENSLIEYYGGVFPSGRQNIKLKLRLGYSTMPQDFVQVCKEKVAEIWQESKRNLADGRLGIQSKSSSGTLQNTTTTFYQLSDRHKAILDQYRYARL